MGSNFCLGTGIGRNRIKSFSVQKTFIVHLCECSIGILLKNYINKQNIFAFFTILRMGIQILKIKIQMRLFGVVSNVSQSLVLVGGAFQNWLFLADTVWGSVYVMLG